jgi:hypothetical protein
MCGSHALSMAQFAKGLGRIDPAGLAPVNELSDVHAALAYFRLVNPDVSDIQLRRQGTLCQLCLLSQAAQHRRQVTVSPGVLGLGHDRQCPANPPCYPFANTILSLEWLLPGVVPRNMLESLWQIVIAVGVGFFYTLLS